MARRREISTTWTRGWIVSAVIALPSLMGSCANPHAVASAAEAELRLINLTEYPWTIATRDPDERPVVWELAPHAAVTVRVAPGHYVFQQTAHVSGEALHREIAADFDTGGRYEWPLATLAAGSDRALR